MHSSADSVDRAQRCCRSGINRKPEVNCRKRITQGQRPFRVEISRQINAAALSSADSVDLMQQRIQSKSPENRKQNVGNAFFGAWVY